VFVTNDDIAEALSFFNPEVKYVKHQLSTAPGVEGVVTGVRNVVMVAWG